MPSPRETCFSTCESRTRPVPSNSRSDNMDFEKDLQRVAEQYTREGYLVVTHPDTDHLPGFAVAFAPQLIARRGDENVIVAVKRDRADLESDPDVPVQAGITNGQPGWRYD